MTIFTYFHGWRRKLGCITMMTALIVFGVWMRSRFVHEGVAFTQWGHQHLVASFDESLWWCHGPLRDDEGGANVAFIEPLSKGERMIQEAQIRRYFVLRVPFWCLTLPLTLLAGYLMLGKRGLPSKTNIGT